MRSTVVAEKFHADDDLGIGRRENIHRIPPHAEGRTGKIHVFARILDGDEPAHKFVRFEFVAHAHRNRQAEKFLGRAEAVDARNRGDHDAVAPFRQRTGGGIAEFIDLVVYGEVLFDISIRGGDVGFRLIIIVVGNEILHAVFGEKFAEFVAQLRRERFIVRDDQRGAVYVSDDVRHREGLAAPRHAEEHLGIQTVQHAFGEFGDRLRLIPRGLIFGM